MADKDVVVTKADQDMINRFAALHTKRSVLDSSLEYLSNEEKTLQDAQAESEEAQLLMDGVAIGYSVGDIFVAMAEDELASYLEDRQAGVTRETSMVEEQSAAIDGELAALKVKLYAKFGDAINLEK